MEKKQSNRRDFIKKSLVAGTGTLLGTAALTGYSRSNEDSEEKIKVLTQDGQLVEVPQSSLNKSPKPLSPKESRHGDPNKDYVMVIDLSKCRNARKCVSSCQKMHYLATEDEWMKVYYLKDNENGAPYWFPKPCFHCDYPPCVNVCPVGATFKRQDGIVLIDNERCIGCKFCMTACPYSTRVFNWKKPEKNPEGDVSYSPETSVPHKMGTVGKCDFCPDMASQGKIPHCASACPNGVIYYGDKNEDTVTNGEETLRFSQLIYDKAGYRYMEELGTHPSVYYLPPVDRLFDPEKGFENLDEEFVKRYEDTKHGNFKQG